MTAAAILLCAGKGTRMNDDTKNKVCFDCAGVPVIKRIIAYMRKGGVSRFVVVVGHMAQSVMDCLDGEEGVVYAYQKEQKGTGHAALCGLKALSSTGYAGPVIISMGDKVVASSVVSDLIEKSGEAKAVWGVQPVQANPNGGRIVEVDGKPFGNVEFADAALMALADVELEQYEEKLQALGLNAKKAAKVMKAALAQKPERTTTLCGTEFTAEQILSGRFANAGLYCFDANAAIEAIGACGSNNAQGEIYLTDTLEYFAQREQAVLYEVPRQEDMLTYSTKTELRTMSLHFMRMASEFIEDIQKGNLDDTFVELYSDAVEEQKKRYVRLLTCFMDTYGDKKVVITRSPGRVNLMGRHIDHRGGGINVMAIDRDTLFVTSPRSDDTVRIANLDSSYPATSFSIGETLDLAPHETWLGYLSAEPVVTALQESRGHWANYVKSALLRAQLNCEMPLCGMDMVSCGNIPVAAGLSSSSSIVVAVMEAVVALNCLNITDKEFIDLCGEGEWFVGSRGGAGDHAAMKCGRRGQIVHLGFKPFAVGESAKFSDRYAILVANSMTQAKKAEGSKDKFNAKVASYEFAFMLLKRAFPECELQEFRDLAKIRPYSKLYRMLKTVPETMTRGGIKALLPEYKDSIEQIFSSHADPGVYDLRGVALYGISECARSEACMEALNDGDYVRLGEMMKISHNGDRKTGLHVTDAMLDELADANTEFALQYGAYDCSTERIDGLCDLLNATDGVLGSELVGAGLGGCVIALVEKAKAESIIEVLNREYYDKYNCEHAANVYVASPGSVALF